MAFKLANLTTTATEVTPQLAVRHLELNHLTRAAELRPYVFVGDVLQQAFSAKKLISTPLFSSLMGLGREQLFSEIKKSVIEINGFQYEWFLTGAADRDMRIVENLEVGNPAPGQGLANGQVSTFKIKVDKALAAEGDTIAPRDKQYQAIVQRYLGGSDVTGYVYEVSLRSQPYLPTQWLEVGEVWIRLGAAPTGIDTRSGNAGGMLLFDRRYKFRNNIGKFWQRFGMTRDAAMADMNQSNQIRNGEPFDNILYVDKTENVMEIKVKGDVPGTGGSNAIKGAFWIQRGEYKFWQTWFNSLEEEFWYGERITNTVLTEDGKSKISGGGLKAMMRFSNRYLTTYFDTEVYEEFLSSLVFDRVSVEGDRTFIGYAGTQAQNEFHKAMLEKLGNNGIITLGDGLAYNKTISKYHKNSLAYGFQFTEFHMPNNLTLRLVNNPLFDNRTINKLEHPTKSAPIESWTIIFLNLDTEQDKENICMLKHGEKIVSLVPGHGGWFGNESGIASHTGPYSELVTSANLGIWIRDITACGEIAYNYTY